MKFFFWLTFPYHEADATLGQRTYRTESSPRASAWIHHEGRAVPMDTSSQPSRICPEQSDGGRFHRQRHDKRKLTPIVTGIDLAQVPPRTRPPERSRSQTLTVGYLGTLVPERRLEVLVDMLAELNERGLHAKLLLIGDGARPEDRRSLQERARMVGVESQLEITGFLPRRDALALDMHRGCLHFAIPPFANPRRGITDQIDRVHGSRATGRGQCSPGPEPQYFAKAAPAFAFPGARDTLHVPCTGWQDAAMMS